MKISIQVEKKVISLYKEEYMMVKDIADNLLIPIKTVSTYLKKNNIQTGRYTYRFNENYFETIDTEDKAYYIGLMYADGNIDRKRDIVSIKLSEKDEETLLKFSSAVKSKKPLYIRKAGKIAGTEYIGKKQYKLELVSAKLKKDLIDRGCIPNKSLILKFPTEDQVPKELQRHFIRGYFDGDGCIYYSKNKIRINIVGTENMLKGIRNVLNKDINITFNIHKENRRDMSYYVFINSKESVRKFCEYIYINSTIKMERKYKKWSDWGAFAKSIEPIKQHLINKKII